MLSITPWISGCAQSSHFPWHPARYARERRSRLIGRLRTPLHCKRFPAVGGGRREGRRKGARSLAPERSTRFTLKATGFLKSDQREWDVQVIPSQSARLLGGIARCDDARFVTTSFTIEQKDTSARTRAVSIANHYQRPLIVSKDAIEVEIPPNSATDRFNAVPVAGSWTIRAPVGAERDLRYCAGGCPRPADHNNKMSCGESVHGNP